ncbi:sugar transferase [Halobiforma nitratireducens]|uniref:Exopolysaccharide biosynthesis polyprenyl glycosylphosphotransferase n=1 Tax=Halobiforma nitratireducens JCM 10879 TaxID=1227454 RepID=M0MN82_9EURY|nr:sugar transferase [Halobiforma nitratireducens]EMA47106.1 exopolysaccharide biosynthesis polyprenyl glycosylphosphotransferase [Halobiforma nitratireducens JCM 10879]
MFTGWRYRLASVLGVVVLTVGAVLVANHGLSQRLFTTYVPVFARLEVTVLSGRALSLALALSVAVVVGSLVPLYKPQPRRVLDTVFVVQKRVLVAALALATLGYFNYSYRLPRATLVMTFGLLAITVPAWFVWIRRRPTDGSERVLVVGDDLEQIAAISPSIDASVLGYLCPSVVGVRDELASLEPATDGGISVGSGDASVTRSQLESLDRIGGLSRMEDAILEFDIDTVVLAFRHADRAEFFGALDACHEHGVDANVHRKYADSVLVTGGGLGELVTVDIEPWDPLDHLGKRLFDVVFAGVGVVAFAPVMGAIAVAIKMESPGPVLYSQDRTAGFGETFSVYKFRTMIPEGASATPSDEEENERITRVGRVLRRTHLDELPQLWSILVGEMSVVGPRAVWTEEEVLLEGDAPAWRKRWFVKPGLTGLAQVNGVTSTAPREKLRYDLEYIRRQSFWFDLKIVVRQIWGVLEDVWGTVRQ